jgi:dicarboxylate/amino acid:cation (Na+ or H+) symporter, DAACS family
VLPTLVFAVLFGLGLSRIGATGRPVIALLEAVMAAMFRVTGWIVSLAPLAVLAIMAWLFATQGLATIAALARLIGLMYLGLLVMVACFWVVLALLRENPFSITRQVLEPVLLAFTTRSSEVTLPVHMETLERMGVPNKVVSLVLPLGYSFNLDGSALYIALAVTFLAEAYNLQLTWSSELTILVTALIASKGIANVPSGGLVALATVLTAVGLPVEAIAVIAGVDAFMDMGRTAVNVFGNTVAVKLVQRLGGSGLAGSDLPDAVANSRMR